jgi:hypothetical protein
VPHNLHDLFERALDGEPVPPPGDPVRQAMAHGRRIRRRRGLLAGASTAAVVVTAAVALNVALAPAEPPPVSIDAALMAPADPACAWPVQDNATDVSIFLSDHIVVLRHWEDHSVDTVAEILGVSASVVKTQSMRALGRLRDLLGEDFARQ